MMHLSYDELFELAEVSSGQDGFDDAQIEQLEHLKTCRDCYESFCLLCALSDVMSESGSYVLSRNENSSLVKEAAEAMKARVLAKFQVIRDTAANVLGTVLEQIDQASTSLQFGPSLAMATRGAGKAASTVIRLEEFEDDKTYIVFNPELNEIRVQINICEMDVDHVHIYIELEDMSKIEIPVTRNGNMVRGSMNDVPNCNFHMVIEAE